MQGLDGEIAFVRGELKELSAMIKAQEEGLQDFKEVRLGSHACSLLLMQRPACMPG